MFSGWNSFDYSNNMVLIDEGIFIFNIELNVAKNIFNGNEHPQGRKGHTLTYSSFDNKIYLYGGWNPLNEEYDNIFFKELWSLNDSMDIITM